MNPPSSFLSITQTVWNFPNVRMTFCTSHISANPWCQTDLAYTGDVERCSPAAQQLVLLHVPVPPLLRRTLVSDLNFSHTSCSLSTQPVFHFLLNFTHRLWNKMTIYSSVEGDPDATPKLGSVFPEMAEERRSLSCTEMAKRKLNPKPEIEKY